MNVPPLLGFFLSEGRALDRLNWPCQRLVGCRNHSDRICVPSAGIFLPLAKQFGVLHDHTTAIVALAHEVLQDRIECLVRLQ